MAAGVLAVVCGPGTGCMPKDPALGPAGTGGAGAPDGAAAGSGGSTASTGGGGGAPSPDGGIAIGGAGGEGGALGGCPESPAPLRPTGTTLELPIDLVFDGKPFVFGEANAVSSTANALPLNIRFYLSKAELLTAAGVSVPLDIVDGTGAVQPYGLFFFNADDATMQTLRVRAPAGTYTGLKIELGLPVACSRGDGGGRAFPLSSDSQMTWPHLLGYYLSFRYDSLVMPNAEAMAVGEGVPSSIHMGADLKNPNLPGALVFRIAGALTIPATGGPVTKRLRLAMDQVFMGATAAVDLTDFPFTMLPEVAAGERLRLTGAGLPLFVFGP